MGSTTGSIIITVKGKEVYVGTAPPSSPVDNELWLDISENNVLKYYKASTKTWCVVNDVSEKFGDVYKYLQTNYYTKTETNNAVKEEIGKTTIVKKDGTVVNMKDAINSVIDTATEHTQKIEDINSKYNSVTGEITEVKTSTSEIKQDLNGFKTTVSENYVDKTEFNNLQIGGTNLLRRGYYLSSNSGLTIKYGENGWVNITGTFTGSTGNIAICDVTRITVTPNEYVLSVERASGENLAVNISIYSNGSWKRNVTIPTSESSVVITIAENETLGYLLISAINGTTYNLKYRFKLEKGNKATDWSPAPEDIEEQITSVKTSIEQTDKYIEANVVKNDEVVTKINASQEGVSIKADKISLEGYTTINDNFKIDEHGNMEAKNGKFSGEIGATSGEIAGLTIKDNSLYHRWYDGVQNGASITHFYFDDMGISSLFKKEGSKKLWIGAHPKIYSAEYVDSDGKVMDENMEYPFYVTDEGYLLSKTGNIAGYDFNSDGFYSPFTTSSRKTQRFAIKSNAKYTEPGTPFIGLQDKNEAFKWFYVKTDGSGYFTNLEVSEDIQSSGKITAQGDIVAGLGTSNQVSLQGLKNDLMGGGSNYFAYDSYGSEMTLPASKNTLMGAFSVKKSGWYLFKPEYRFVALPSGRVVSVRVFEYTNVQYPVKNFQGSVTLVGAGIDFICMNGIQIFQAKANTKYYIYGYSAGGTATCDSLGWYNVYCLKTT